MRPKMLEITRHIVELAVNKGWDEAHDALEDPSDEQILEFILDSVMHEFNEYFEFDDPVE